MEQQYHKRTLESGLAMIFLRSLALIVMSISQTLAGDTNSVVWGAATNGVQMSITLEVTKNVIETKRPVRLRVRIRNVSTNETFYFFNSSTPDTNPDNGLACWVVSPTGKDVSPDTKSTVFGHSGAYGTITQNQTEGFGFDLERICNFNEVGTYKIIARKAITSLASRKSFIVVSNPLSLEVAATRP